MLTIHSSTDVRMLVAQTLVLQIMLIITYQPKVSINSMVLEKAIKFNLFKMVRLRLIL